MSASGPKSTSQEPGTNKQRKRSFLLPDPRSLRKTQLSANTTVLGIKKLPSSAHLLLKLAKMVQQSKPKTTTIKEYDYDNTTTTNNNN